MYFIENNNYIQMSKRMFFDFQRHVNEILKYKKYINLILATGDTLIEFTKLINDDYSVPYNRINLYIVDEYAGIHYNDERSCTIDIINLIPSINKFKSINWFSKNNYVADIRNYNSILKKEGIDICILGVGADGHIGFCYPPDYNVSNDYYILRPFSFKEKKLHVNNGWFDLIKHVPDNSITLSILGIKSSKIIMIAAIYSQKKEIVDSLKCKMNLTGVPVAYLLENDNAYLYLG